MRRAATATLFAALITPGIGGAAPKPRGEADINTVNAAYAIANLEFREAAYDIYQRRYYSGISQLLDATRSANVIYGKSDSKAFLADFLYQQRNLTDILQILVGGRLSEALLSKDETDVVMADLYIALGMPRQAEQLLQRLGSKRTAATKHSWLALARYYYRRGDVVQAEKTLDNLKNLPQGEIQWDQDSLTALVLLGSHREQDAIAILKEGSANTQANRPALDRYNLGLALLEQGNVTEGASVITQLADIPGTPPNGSLRELADVNLAYILLDNKQLDQAAALLQAHAQSDALSNYAQLGIGWTASLSGDYRKALENWLPLIKRQPSDAAAQEAMVAVPNVYYQQHDYKQALNYYQLAIETYQHELTRLHDARNTIAAGQYLDVFLKTNPGNQEFDALWQATSLPTSPITSYLLPTLASHRFQEAVKNYRDLLSAQEMLAVHDQDINASLNLLATQRQAHERWQQQKVEINKDIDPAALAARARKIRADLERAEANHDVMTLATVNQKKLLFTLKRANTLLDKLKDYIVDHEDLQAKYELLRGLMIWELTQQYPARLEEVRQQLQEMETLLSRVLSIQATLNRSGDQINTAQTTLESGYQALGVRQAVLLANAKTLANKQRDYINTQLVQALTDGENKLNGYIRQAMFGIAQTTDQVITASGKKDYAPAIAAYQKVLDEGGQAPFRREMMFRLAFLKMTQADYRDAEQAAAPTRAGSQLNDAMYDEAIVILTRLLKDYPDDSDNERILYNLAKAYDHRGETDALLDTLDRFTRQYPRSEHIDELQFRRGEVLFSLGLPGQAGEAYTSIVAKGPASPFYDKAVYKLGWSQYKEGRYDAAIDTFLPLLQRKLTPAANQAGDITLTRGEEELNNDIQRGAILSLAQLGGVESLGDYFARHGAQPYEFQLYEMLAQLYLEQQRIEDAANVYRAFVTHHPDDLRAPLFDSRILAVYEQGRFIDQLQSAREKFIGRYRPDAAYWANNPDATRDETIKQVRGYMLDLTRYNHAKAQRSKTAQDYQHAASWYKQFLTSFPQDPQTAEMTFLYAELLFEAQHYADAAQQYETVAYEYKDKERAAEAAYAAVLAREKLAAADAPAAQQWLASLQRFAESFPADSRASAALIKAAQEWFARGDRPQAVAAAEQLLAMKPEADAALRLSAWSIVAHSQFAEQHYADAEQSYKKVLELMARDDTRRRDLDENLAASVYKQGEQSRTAGDQRGAARHFLRIADLTPSASIVATAQYDAAAALLSVEDWRAAIKVLERFRTAYPDSPLQKELPPKLAVAYQKVSDWSKAAAELETIASHGESEELKRDAVWQSAELYLRAGQQQQGLRVFADYVQRFPKPVAEAVEARQRLADLYARQNDLDKRDHWLRQIIEADKQAGTERSDRTRLLAGRAALVLADERYQAFAALGLKNPLKKSLAVKKKAMEEALTDYRAAGEYGIAEITTAATYRTAQIYSDLARALLDSERPKGLSDLELEQYNVLLEEQAYPFEEQAIGLHEANARRAASNIYDEAVKQSFAALSKLMPGRYAKPEKGEAYVEEIY